MKLELEKRTTGKRGVTQQIRREGNIPAILYDSAGAGEAVCVKGDEMRAILRSLRPGLLATTVFSLSLGNKKIRAIVKDVQYHVASYEIEHIDFLELKEDRPVTVNVAVHLLGAAECVGVKLGGFIRQVVRALKVKCLPKDIPQEFVIDVKELNVAESKRLSDIQIPANVRPLGRMDEVAVVIGKKAGT